MWLFIHNFFLLGLFFLTVPIQCWTSPYTYTCNENKEIIGGHKLHSRCVKSVIKDTKKQHSLAACKLSCGKYGALWPHPSGHVNLSKEVFTFDSIDKVTFDITHTPEQIHDLLAKLEAIFRGYLKSMAPHSPTRYDDKETVVEKAKSDEIVISLLVHMADKKLVLQTDESYELNVTELGRGKYGVNVTAQTYFGARHAIETLSQMIAYDDNHNVYLMLKHAVIKDAPVYPHRGLLIDTSRNWFSLDILKQIIDGLSYNKLNVFHWHITDTHSFPMELEMVPELTQWGAYSRHQVYTKEDIQYLVEYARVRGVKIVPEFDAPAHVGNGWQFAEKKHPEWGRLAVCVNQEEWQDYCVEPPCGQLNVVNEKMYEILAKVYTDMFKMFDSDVFHMGGDEVNFNCWNTSKEITDHLRASGMSTNKMDFLGLWSRFQRRAYNLVVRANNNHRLPAIIWTNSMTQEGVEKFLSKNDYIIQIWTTGKDQTIKDIIDKGYKTIFSNYDAWYLDCGYSSWVGEGNNWCSPYKGWQLVYDNSPRRIYRNFGKNVDKEKNILGGEACMWSEQVQGDAIQGKLWPRGAALGERLWTDPDTNWKEAETRMLVMRQRMVERGIAADAIQPEWCHQNEGHCYVRKPE